MSQPDAPRTRPPARLIALALFVLLAGFAAAYFWRDARTARAELAAAREQLHAIPSPPAQAPPDATDARTRALLDRHLALVARWEYARTVQHAYRLWELNKIGDVRTLLEGTPAELRDWEHDYLYHLSSPGRSRPVAGSRPVAPASLHAPDRSKVLQRDGIVVLVRDVASGATQSELRGHRAPVRGVAWNPAGTRIATVGEDDTLRVWDAVTGAELLTLAGSETVAFSADGQHIYTHASDGAGLVYDSGAGNRPVFRVPVAPPPRPVAR